MFEPQRRVVHGSFCGEKAPVTTEPVINQGILESLTMALLRVLGDFAFEASLIVATAMTYATLLQYSVPIAISGTVVWLAALFGYSPSRRYVITHLRQSRLRRQWDRAAHFAGLVTMNDHVPTLHEIRETPAGYRMKVRIPAGSTPTALEEATERLATCLGAREVKVERDRTSASQATVHIVRTDPLSGDQPLPWPQRDAERLSVWDPIPVGVNEFGQTVNVSLPERNLLLGGEPGAGKSVALSQLVATVALDSDCELTLLDGKRVELAAWSECARNVVGPSIEDAIRVLRTLQVEMDARYERLLAEGKRKVDRDSGIPLHVVVCDELAFYLTMGDRKANQEFATVARDLVARGRAAGVIFLAATQKPSHDIIPTSLRDLFAFRWALRCSTPQASDTILGQGWAGRDCRTDTIDAADRGVGYLLHEGGEPIRMKAYCLSDSDLAELGKRGADLRKANRPLRAA